MGNGGFGNGHNAFELLRAMMAFLSYFRLKAVSELDVIITVLEIALFFKI